MDNDDFQGDCTVEKDEKAYPEVKLPKFPDKPWTPPEQDDWVKNQQEALEEALLKKEKPPEQELLVSFCCRGNSSKLLGRLNTDGSNLRFFDGIQEDWIGARGIAKLPDRHVVAVSRKQPFRAAALWFTQRQDGGPDYFYNLNPDLVRNVHSLVFVPPHTLYVVSTRFNAIVKVILDEEWKPVAQAFHYRFDESNRETINVNSIDWDGNTLSDGSPQFIVTMQGRNYKTARTKKVGSVRASQSDGKYRILKDQIYNPHTVKSYKHSFVYCASGSRTFHGPYHKEQVMLPGYTRGVAICDHRERFYVGFSAARKFSQSEPGKRLEVDPNLEAGLAVIEMNSMIILKIIKLADEITEIYDVELINNG